MKREYNTRCWLCGSTDLEPDSRGMRCRSCGATYNLIPKPGASPRTIENDPLKDSYSPRKETLGHPSATTIRRATKARGDI